MKKNLLLAIFGFVFFFSSQATVYTVNTNNDANTGGGTTGTLRWCIVQANSTPAADTINFSYAGTFTVASNYPVISSPLTINGFSAPGAVQGQLGAGSRVMKIILNGPGTSSVYGLQITANNCEISGLVIQDFYKGIYINGGDNNWIWGCYVGTSFDGSSALAATTCWDDGIALSANANNNIIGTNGDGTNDANEGNLIAGNGDSGTQFFGECISLNEGGVIAANCSGNRIAGNYLGTNETGTAALYFNGTAGKQRGSGIQINYSTLNIIGTNGDGVSDALERNVISGNSDCGIVLMGGGSNKVKGNYIGTDNTGLLGLPNYSDGGGNISCTQIVIKSGSANNIIGTDGDGVNDNIEGNVIGSATITGGVNSVSYNYAIFISASTGTTVAGNKIGIGADGVTALNIKTISGDYIDKCIYVSSASTSTIIGTDGDGVSDSYESNYLGNSGSGVTIDGSNSCIIAGNYFGLGTNLTTAEQLSSSGAYILSSTTCRIGSSALNNLERNYFCNSDYDGVWVDGGAISTNDLINIRYNTFGIRPDNIPAPNAYHGIEIYQRSNADTVQYNIVTQNGTVTPNGTYSAILIGGPSTSDESIGCVIFQNQVYKNIGRGIDILGNLSVQNKVSQNSIYDNGNASNSTASSPAFGKYSLGLDNDYDGTTLNDPKDPDTGPNGLSNFPVITAAVPGGSSCSELISGTFNGLASTQYYVEVFASDVCNGDTAGTNNFATVGYNYGEGRTYVGTSSTFTTDINGNGAWSLSAAFSTIVGQYITATSIQNSGTGINNTSEFSKCFYVSYDCGDAPDTYHTLLSNCGPVHLNVNNNLKIGSTVTVDLDGMPGPQANGDVDDGISSFPTLTEKSTTYSLTNIPVTNTTGSTATLYAWIDFNVNGSFELSEFTSVSVPSTGAQTVNLTWSSLACGTNITPGNAYLRMRLTTSALSDNAGTTTVDERSYGEASNGEVEDYKLYIAGYDYGDLPNTYPTATMLCLEDTATAKVWAGVTKPSLECSQKYSADAMGDGSEEDGLTISIGPSGSSYNWVVWLNANQASKTVYYGLWIDWDGNQDFTSGLDAFYSGSAVVTGLTNKNVSVYSPFGITGNSSFRLIVSDAPLTLGMYNATITNGEVEDWILYRILTSPNYALIGTKQLKGNLLRWTNSSGQIVANYSIEKSTDNISWLPIGNINPLSLSNFSMQYSYVDEAPNSQNFYRIKISLPDNTYQYSNILPLSNSSNSPILIYPNPALDFITIKTLSKDYVQAQISDLAGRVEILQSINSFDTKINISNLSTGNYVIKLITKNGNAQIQKFIKIKN